MEKIVSACEISNGNCWNCCYADMCGSWNDTDPYDIPQIKVPVTVASMSLCQGRHEIPEATDGSIFGNELDPLAVEDLETEAFRKLEGLQFLNLYVTGLTVALVAALNACRTLGIEVTLYHFDRTSGTYYPQKIRR